MNIVLLVHNHGVYRAGLKLLLVYELGVRVLEAADGPAALELLRRERIDLIILAEDLPHGARQAVLAFARRQRPTLPTVVLSSRDFLPVYDRTPAAIAGPTMEKQDFLAFLHTLLQRVRLPLFF